MWRRVRAAVCGCCVAAGPGVAADPPGYARVTVGDGTPAALPPLLPVPGTPVTPALPAKPPGGPAVDYDRSLLYLPDSLPKAAGPTRVEPEEQHFWLSAGVFQGWSDAQTAPPLLTAPSATGPVTVFSDGGLAVPYRPGFQFDGGLWLNRDRTYAVDGGAIYLAPGVDRFEFASDGSPPLTRPTRTPAGSGSAPLAGPGEPGWFAAEWATRFVSADVNVRRVFYRDAVFQVAGAAGYRFAYLAEDLRVEVSRATAAGVTQSDDRAGVRNYFHGGQLSVAGGAWWRGWSVDATGKVGLGAVFATSTLTGTGDPAGGGFLVRPANAGDRSDLNLASLTAVSLTVGRQVLTFGKVFAGYTILHVSNVTRPGDLIDAGDPTGPGLALRRGSGTTDFWIQGLNVGMEWSY